MSDSLQPHGLQHTRPPSITNSQSLLRLISIELVMPSNHLIPFSSCHQSFPAGSFPVSQLFISGGQCTGVWTSTSVLPMNIQDWFPLGWTGWISLQSRVLSRVFSNITIQKHQFFGTQLSVFPLYFNKTFITQKLWAIKPHSSLAPDWILLQRPIIPAYFCGSATTFQHRPAMRETWVRSLGWEDILEKEMATHSSTLAWKIPWMEDPRSLQSMVSQRVRHDWVTSLSDKPFYPLLYRSSRYFQT